MNTLENGKTYLVDHQRKGRFLAKLISHDDEWATLEIRHGKAQAKLTYNEREVGESVSVRRSLCRFSPSEGV